MSYVSTETEGHVNICVDVLNPAAEGALRPFTVGLIPEAGMSKSANCFIAISRLFSHLTIKVNSNTGQNIYISA